MVDDTSTVSSDPEAIWTKLKNDLLDASKDVCGSTKKFQVKRMTWWWDDNVDQLISMKRKLWKAWKAGSDKEPYLAAKREAKKGVFHAKREAEKKQFSTLKHGEEIFRRPGSYAK